MAKQHVLYPSRRATTLAILGFAALVTALLGMAWVISTRTRTPQTSPTIPARAPAAPVTNAAPTNRFFADEIAGASVQNADAAILIDPLPERLQDIRRPAAVTRAPALPAHTVPGNRRFADEVFGSGELVLQTDSTLPYVTPLHGPR